VTTEADQQAIADLRQKVRLRDRELALANEENDALRKQVAAAKRERDEAHAAIPADHVLPPLRTAIDMTDLPAHVVATIEAIVRTYRPVVRVPAPPEAFVVDSEGPDLEPSDVVNLTPGRTITLPVKPNGFRLEKSLWPKDPKIVRLLQAIGRPATAVEIANFSGLGVNSIYQAARRYRDLVHQDQSNPTRYSVRAPAAPGAAP
jgi:hypothetical protein